MKSRHQFQTFKWNANKSGQICKKEEENGEGILVLFLESIFGVTLVQHLLLISQQ